MGLRDVLFGPRDAAPAGVRMIGFPTDGGLVSGVSPTTALGLSSVWRCLDVLCNGTSQLEWRELLGNLDLPPSRLVERPQAARTRREWVSLVVSTVALFDVCYLLKAGRDTDDMALGLWPIDPSLISPQITDQWSLLPPDRYWLGNVALTADDLVIIRRSPQPSITEPLSGVLNLARVTFAAAIASEGYASRYWQAGGAPTTVLESDANVPQTTADQISEAWANRRAKGPDHAPVLSGGLKAKSFGADPTAESAVEARREMVADVGRYFGVPTRILNAPTGDSETYTSAQAANQDLVRYTLQNYIGAIQDAISSQLPAGRRMVMDTWTLTRPDALAEAQSYQLATGGKAWIAPEEVRERLGFPPIESPDTLNPPAPVPVAAGGPANDQP